MGGDILALLDSNLMHTDLAIFGYKVIKFGTLFLLKLDPRRLKMTIIQTETILFHHSQ